MKTDGAAWRRGRRRPALPGGAAGDPGDRGGEGGEGGHGQTPGGGRDGGASTPPALWEDADLTIPLNWTYTVCEYASRIQEFTARYRHTVREHLYRAAQDGWEAAGPTDWGTMWAAGRIKHRVSRPGKLARLVGFRTVETFESVTIRVKRRGPAPAP